MGISGLSGLSGLSAIAGGLALSAYTRKLLAMAPVAYWPILDLAGSVMTDVSGHGAHGQYVNVALGQSGIGDGQPAGSWNGSTSYGGLFSSYLAANMAGSEGTIALWVNVSGAGILTDGVSRFLVRFRGANSSNEYFIQRTATNNQVMCNYRGAGTLKQVPIVLPTGWHHIAMTWSLSGDAMKGYLDGVQQATTQVGLGAFSVGTPIAANMALGSQFGTSASAVWSGLVGHAIMFNTARSGADILSMATV